MTMWSLCTAAKPMLAKSLDVHIFFFAHKGDSSISTTFVIPKVSNEVFVAKENILYIDSSPKQRQVRKKGYKIGV